MGLLRNRYYLGFFTWDGVEYQGNHQALVDQATSDAVQAVLEGRNAAGEEQRVHNHYLKGTVRCGGCGSRLCITHTRNRWGTLYVYFFCLGRQQRRTICVRKAVPVEVVEERVEELWTSVDLSPEYVELITELVRQELSDYREQAARTRASATRRLEILQNERRKLLQAHYADAVPVELLKSEQDRITAEVNNCERQLAGAGAAEDAIEARLQTCLSLVTDAGRTYSRVTPRCGAG